MQDAVRIACYSRKSKFTGKGESIDNQVELCRQYIRSHFPGCADDGVIVYEDEGFSGGNTERPKFKQMLADARARRFSAIVCYRLDRISRNIGDFAKLIEELDTLGIAFVSIKEQFDTSSPMGRAMMYISSVFSQLERETIAERIRDNMHELSKTGRWLGGTTPTGYVSESEENVTVDGKVKKACRLKPVSEEAALVRRIFDVFLETGSLTKTEAYLHKNGCRTKTGRGFTRFALRNILTNPVYMLADDDAYRYLTENGADLFAARTDFDGERGIMAYNRTVQQRGRANQLRPLNEWIVAVGKHTGLISGADWIKAQAVLERNRSKCYRRPRSHTALLSGLLFCGGCGGYMRPKQTQRLNAQGEYIYTYLCTMKERSCSHVCAMKNANGNLLDASVCEELTRICGDGAELMRRLEHGRRRLEADDGHDADAKRLREALAENEKAIAALVGAIANASGTPAEGYILTQIDGLHNASEQIKQRLAQLNALAAGQPLSDAEAEAVTALCASFRTMLGQMDTEQLRAALRMLIKKIVWDGANAQVYLLGNDDGSHAFACL